MVYLGQDSNLRLLTEQTCSATAPRSMHFWKDEFFIFSRALSRLLYVYVFLLHFYAALYIPCFL